VVMIATEAIYFSTSEVVHAVSSRRKVCVSLMRPSAVRMLAVLILDPVLLTDAAICRSRCFDTNPNDVVTLKATLAR